MILKKHACFNTAKNKGQVNLYFIISVVLFLTLSIYLIFMLISYNNSFREDMLSNVLYSKSVSVSELLIRDLGYPADWNSSNFERIGLASNPYILDPTKITELEKICNSSDLTKFKKLKKAFGLVDEDLSLKLIIWIQTAQMYCTVLLTA